MPVIRLDLITTRGGAEHLGRAWLEYTGAYAVCVEYRGADHGWRWVYV